MKVNPAAMQGKDLLSQLPKRPVITAPAGLIKSIVLDAVIVVLSLVSGFLLSSYLAGGTGFWTLIVGIGVFMAVSVLGTLLTKDPWHRAGVIGLESLFFLLPFWGAPFDLLSICFGIMVVFLLWGEYLSREDASNSVEIRFFHVIKRPLSKILSAVAMVGVILYIPVWNKNPSFISEATFDSIYSVSTKVMGGLYPEFKFSSDIGTFAKSVAQNQLEKTMNFNLLPAAIKNQALNDLSQKILDSLGNTFGFKLDAKNTFGETIFAFLNKSLSDLRLKFGTTFLTIWGIAVFLFVRSLATLLGYVISFVSFLLYHSLIAFGIVRVRTENKPHEVVEFF